MGGGAPLAGGRDGEPRSKDSRGGQSGYTCNSNRIQMIRFIPDVLGAEGIGRNVATVAAGKGRKGKGTGMKRGVGSREGRSHRGGSIITIGEEIMHKLESYNLHSYYKTCMDQ